jgi:hypothetical protein
MKMSDSINNIMVEYVKPRAGKLIVLAGLLLALVIFGAVREVSANSIGCGIVTAQNPFISTLSGSRYVNFRGRIACSVKTGYTVTVSGLRYTSSGTQVLGSNSINAEGPFDILRTYKRKCGNTATSNFQTRTHVTRRDNSGTTTVGSARVNLSCGGF